MINYYEEGKKKRAFRAYKNHIRNRYDISLEQFLELVKIQEGRCAICNEYPDKQPKKKRLCVDHDHKTGLIRGLLCDRCNKGISYFLDSTDLLYKAIYYLKTKSKILGSCIYKRKFKIDEKETKPNS